MITKYVQLWFVVPKHQVSMAWNAIAAAVKSKGGSFLNLPDGKPTPDLPLALDWADLPEATRPDFARTEADWHKYLGNRRDIKIVTFIIPGNGRGIEEILQEWQALSQEGVFVGGSWATGFNSPDPLYNWNYAGQVGHSSSYAGW